MLCHGAHACAHACTTRASLLRLAMCCSRAHELRRRRQHTAVSLPLCTPVPPLRPSARAVALYASQRQLTSNNNDNNDALDEKVSSDDDDVLARMLHDAGCHRADTTSSQQSYHAKNDNNKDDDNDDDAAAATATHTAPVQWQLHTLQMHNMPRTWLYEDVISFIDSVAAHAGIAAPSPRTTAAGHAPNTVDGNDDNENKNNDDDDDDDDEAQTALPHTTSPHVDHVHMFFGRRSGIIYRDPLVTVTSSALAHYLLKQLTFAEDDYRSRITFSNVTDAHELARLHELHTHAGRTRPYRVIEDAMAREQEEALHHLELDRYLFAPDMLLDISKLHQRKLVTRGEHVFLDAFRDDPRDAAQHTDNGDVDEEDKSVDDGGEEDTTRAQTPPSSQHAQRTRHRLRRRRTVRSRRAGAQRTLGHGSPQNLPLPRPYVQGRML